MATKAQIKHARSVARSGGLARMESMDAKERSRFARQGGLAGSAARAKALTKTQRQAIARKAAAARWGKPKSK
jgi:hypothetical protein